MVKVATRPAENPVGLVARKLNLSGMVREPPKLNLPGKLVFPSMHNSGHFSMLGLGDIVMPGLLLCFVLRYDSYKKSQIMMSAEAGVPPPRSMLGSKLTYFHCSLLGWVSQALHCTEHLLKFQLQVLSRTANSYSQFRGLQASSASSLVSRTVHAPSAFDDGLSERWSKAHVDGALPRSAGNLKTIRSLRQDRKNQL